MASVNRITTIKSMTARKLSFSFPVHASAVNRGRLKPGSELRQIEVIEAGKKKKTGIFFGSDFSCSGLDRLTVTVEGKAVEVDLKLPKDKRQVELDFGTKAPKEESVFHGIPGSSGIASSRALLYLQWEKGVPIRKYSIEKKNVESEVGRMKQALAKATAYYDGLISDPSVGNDTTVLLEAHRRMAVEMANKVEQGIRTELLNAEHVLGDIVNQFVARLESGDNQYFRDRAFDFKDVGRVFLEHLSGTRSRRTITGQEVILVANEILPSDMAEIMAAKARVVGIVTEAGGPTSHATVIAKQLGIPAVLGVNGATKMINDADRIIVDGIKGTVVISPAEATEARYGAIKSDYDLYTQKLISEVRGKPSATMDGAVFHIGANIMTSLEVGSAVEHEADHIGLFRTEGLLIGKKGPISEDEQFEIYRKIFGISAKIRTFDIGGDKLAGSEVDQRMKLPHEANPFLGLRGVRLYDYNDFWRGVFRTQVRAILRAGAENPGISIMIPMVTKLYEFTWAKNVIEMEKAALREAGIGHNGSIKVGVMVEVPSLVAVARELAKEADYFSFGSNDMIQYMMAVDRGNPSVAGIYDPFHYSIIWSIRQFVSAAHSEGKPFCVCGDMASDPVAMILLLGLGADGISMSASDIPKIKYVLQGLEKARVVDLVGRILNEKDLLMSDTKDRSIRDGVKELIKKEFPLGVIERINLVSGRLSPSRSI